MKIMLLADVESKALWDYFDKSKLDGIDLIISAGDLHAHYLSFLATFTKAPVLYVHGNHDTGYDTDGPDGCICIDDTIFVYKGLRVMGLGGSMRYKPGSWQYTEKQMMRRASKLRRKIRRRKGFDILVTHAPARGLGDGEDLPHRGFMTFKKLMDKYHPSYHVYGHVHKTYGSEFVREISYNDTKLINAYEKYVIEIEDPPIPPEKWLSVEHFKRWRWEKFRK
jgi:predicted phosphodiesterase